MRLIAAIGCLAVAACGGGGTDSGNKDGDRIACARLETGPFQDVVASAAPDGDAPAIVSANAYRSGDGFVTFGAYAAGDYGVFLDAAVDVEVTDDTGTVIAPSETGDSSTECVEVARRVIVPMAIGVYFIELSGVGADPVTLAIEPVALDTDG